MSTTLSDKATCGHRQAPGTTWGIQWPAQTTGFWAGVGSLVDIAGTGFRSSPHAEFENGFEEDARQIGGDFKAAVEHEVPQTVRMKRGGKLRFVRKVRRIVSKRSDRSSSRRPAKSV